MPTIRKLRNEDVFELDIEDDEFESAADDPFATSTTVSTMASDDVKPDQSSLLSNVDAMYEEYECDIDLP